MPLREVGFAKIVIQKDLVCRVFITKDLSNPTDEDLFLGTPTTTRKPENGGQAETK